MRHFLCISALVAVAFARPEPPVGYNYPQPSSQYGIPSHGGGLGGGQGFSSGSLGGFHGISSGVISAGSLGGGLGGVIYAPGGADAGFSSGSAGFGSGVSGPSVITSGPSLVHKHVYVHVAPEDPEEVRPQRPIVLGAPQKHYKIIFIKAPSPPTPTAPVIPLQPQNEEKTLVYVLVKKPEQQPDIVVPAAAPTPPTKPEVYFIKYNTQKQAVSGGAGISAGGISGGVSSAGIGGIGSLGGIEGAAIGGSSFGDASIGGHGGSFGASAEGIGAGIVHGSADVSGVISGSSQGVSSKYGPPGYQH
ncbi:hypothetical protein JTB14_001648 [Gonioctena quinquepunctata]|nr:hypothetical protein JTB14_001648 [Gonioctena quinquepunctata]